MVDVERVHFVVAELVDDFGHVLDEFGQPRLATEPDAHVEQFRTRSLAEAGPFTFAAADALVLKVREGGRVARCLRWSRPVSTPMGTGRSSVGALWR